MHSRRSSKKKGKKKKGGASAMETIETSALLSQVLDALINIRVRKGLARNKAQKDGVVGKATAGMPPGTKPEQRDPDLIMAASVAEMVLLTLATKSSADLSSSRVKALQSIISSVTWAEYSGRVLAYHTAKYINWPLIFPSVQKYIVRPYLAAAKATGGYHSTAVFWVTFLSSLLPDCAKSQALLPLEWRKEMDFAFCTLTWLANPDLDRNALNVGGQAEGGNKCVALEDLTSREGAGRRQLIRKALLAVGIRGLSTLDAESLKSDLEASAAPDSAAPPVPVMSDPDAARVPFSDAPKGACVFTEDGTRFDSEKLAAALGLSPSLATEISARAAGASATGAVHPDAAEPVPADATCAMCTKAGPKMRCPCREARYCDRACQRRHWKAHKPGCSAAPAAKKK